MLWHNIHTWGVCFLKLSPALAVCKLILKKLLFLSFCFHYCSVWQKLCQSCTVRVCLVSLFTGKQIDQAYSPPRPIQLFTEHHFQYSVTCRPKWSAALSHTWLIWSAEEHLPKEVLTHPVWNAGIKSAVQLAGCQ